MEELHSMFFELWKKAAKKRGYNKDDRWLRLEAAIFTLMNPRDVKKLRRMTYDERKLLKLETCHAGKDGDCNWKDCPQNREGEPERTGRHCPYDFDDEEY